MNMLCKAILAGVAMGGMSIVSVGPGAEAMSPSHASTPAVAVTAAPKPTYKVIARGGVNLRSGPSVKHKKVGLLAYGKTATGTGKVSGGWIQLKLSTGAVAWAASSALSKTTKPAAGPAAYSVTAKSGLKVRSGPSTGSAAVGTLASGTVVAGTGSSSKGWTQVSLTTGPTGWVSDKYLSKSKSVAYRVLRSGVYVRSGPSRSYKVIATIAGDKLIPGSAGHPGGWVKVSLSDGRSGYSSAALLARASAGEAAMMADSNAAVDPDAPLDVAPGSTGETTDPQAGEPETSQPAATEEEPATPYGAQQPEQPPAAE